MSTVQETVDVVVIGGGISGLSAAKLLKEQGLEVVVLEARDRVGGRTHTVRNDKCGYTDVGGAYIGPGQRRVARMAKEFGLEFYKIHHSQKTVMNVQGTWRTYRGTIPPVYNPLVLLDLNNFECLIETMSAEVPVDSPWKAPKAKEWDAMTFKEFIDKNLWTNTSKFFATTVVRGLMCVEPEEISLLHCLWYIKSGQGLQRITSVDDGAQERKFVGGAQQLSECMADGLDDQVKLSSPVVRVIQEDEVVTAMTLDGKVYKGQYIVSAMPLSLLNRVTFDPPLPPMKIQMIQRMPMGSIVKTMTFYDKPYWREKSLCGEMVCDKSPIIYCVDDTKPDGSYPCIMGFILADRAREFCDLSKEERMHAVANQYAEVFKCEEMRKPVHYEEQNWMAEEYSGGCYVSCMPPGAMTRYSQELRVPFKRVYFATTETATCWAGYMEGAIQAGERAAREILHDLGRIPSSQIWQDEPEHDNFPDVPVKHLHEPYLPSVTQLLWMAAIAALGVAVYACNYMSKL